MFFCNIKQDVYAKNEGSEKDIDQSMKGVKRILINHS
jgi:hypothetical protein